MIRAFNYHYGGLGSKELTCGYASNDSGHSSGQVRIGCGWNLAWMEVGQHLCGADFPVLIHKTEQAQKRGWGAGKTSTRMPAIPKDPQGPWNHFHKSPEEQTAHAHSFAWRTRNLISGWGKFSCAKEPHRVQVVPCHLDQLWTQVWGSPFLSYLISLQLPISSFSFLYY